MKRVSLTTVRRGAFLGLSLLLCAGAAHAQLYKWTDANGKTHFSDQPPPSGAKPATLKSARTGTVTPDMPYALATAARNFPVTLYTTKPCGGCDQGRSYLRTRGIPFNEKTVSTAQDEAKLKEAGSDGNLPFVTIGSSKIIGYSQAEWESALNVAQYPAQKMLPASYQYPPATALVAPPPKVAAPDPEAARLAAEEAAEKRRREAERPASNAPPGFRF
jgi:glutaredoxin